MYTSAQCKGLLVHAMSIMRELCCLECVMALQVWRFGEMWKLSCTSSWRTATAAVRPRPAWSYLLHA